MQPIGALNPERLKKFQERYSTFEDPIIPKFHYGSHYSSAGTVYLSRYESDVYLEYWICNVNSLLDYVACNFDIWSLSSAYLVITMFDLCTNYYYPFQVLYYLFRVEPFTTLSIQLQDGKFDHADRMFSDLSGTWDSVLEDMSDVKELVSLPTSICSSSHRSLLVHGETKSRLQQSDYLMVIHLGTRDVLPP